MPGPTERLARQSCRSAPLGKERRFERDADDAVVHCVAEHRARALVAAIEDRLKRVGLQLNRDNHEGGRLLQGPSAAARRDGPSAAT